MRCDEVREHLESCGECGLYLEVEARLRALPVVEPPARLTSRVLRALPGPASTARELVRLAAAAAALLALTASLLLSGLDRHPAAEEARARGEEILQAMVSTLNPLRSDRPWKH